MHAFHHQLVCLHHALLALHQPDIRACVFYTPVIHRPDLHSLAGGLFTPKVICLRPSSAIAELSASSRIKHLHATTFVSAEDARLGCNVLAHVAVTIHMIFADVQHGGRIRIQRCRGLQLEAG